MKVDTSSFILLNSASCRSFSALICSAKTISCIRSFTRSEVNAMPSLIKESIMHMIASNFINRSLPFPFLKAVNALALVKDLFHSLTSTSSPVDTLIFILGSLFWMRTNKVAYPSFLSVLKIKLAAISYLFCSTTNIEVLFKLVLHWYYKVLFRLILFYFINKTIIDY